MKRIFAAALVLILLVFGGISLFTNFGAQDRPAFDETAAPFPRSAPDTGSEKPQTAAGREPAGVVVIDKSGPVAPQEEPVIVTEEAIVLPDENPDFREVPIFFGTNRQKVPDFTGTDPADQFTDVNGDLVYGYATVTLPREHKRGVLESQNWFSAIFFEPDPKKHVVLQDMFVDEDENVFASVRDQLASTDNAILLYVHGFNTSLNKAARRTGQLTYDLDWQGPSFLFSWPSQGASLDYLVDSTLAQRSYGAMADMLEKLTDQDPEKVVVIAHSMGTRVLSHGLARLADRNPEAANKITTVILAAPDIDEQVFINDLAPRFRALNGPEFTLYASAKDSALSLSKKANGFPRIGDTTDGIPEIEGIEVIDATTTTSNFFEHTYFAESTSILSDIYLMVQKCTPLTDRQTVLHWANRDNARPVLVSSLPEEERATADTFWQIAPPSNLPEPIPTQCE